MRHYDDYDLEQAYDEQADKLQDCLLYTSDAADDS